MKIKMMILVVCMAPCFSMGAAPALGIQGSSRDLLLETCAFDAPILSFRRGLIMHASAGTAVGLTCKQLRTFIYDSEIVSATVLPLDVLKERNPEMATLVFKDALAAGLNFANPTVLALTITGDMSAGVVYVIVDRTLEECRHALTQKRLLIEAERLTGARMLRPIRLNVQAN